ncbi:hypothetical protein GOV06_02735 [Candidatus Woesearchaeota archaeon]|nr:hypothetical protein [Candidatus Woesearchaeota archaeon]
MTIESRLVKETYAIDGTDKTGLIPEETTAVIVHYEDGKPVSLYYHNPPIADLLVGKKLSERGELMDKISERNPKKIAAVLKLLRGEEKITEEYVALYKEGRDQPCGAIRKLYADEVVKQMKASIGEHFWTEPITSEEAKEIERSIVERPLSKGVEDILGSDK